jgi:hypothetical protein
MIAIGGLFKRWVVRPIVFTVPLSIVAKWCDLQPTWQLFVWTFFCLVWSDWTDGIGSEASEVVDRKTSSNPAPVLLTRAQLAAVDNPLQARLAAKGQGDD